MNGKLLKLFVLLFLFSSHIKPLLAQDCAIQNVIVEAHPCTPNGIFYVDLAFEYENVGDAGFSVVGNGNDYGDFDYGEPFITGMTYKLILTDDAKKFVAEKGFDPQFGARPLHRAIQKYIEDPLAEFILSNNPAEGSVLEAKLNKESDGLVISLSKKVNTDVKE